MVEVSPAVLMLELNSRDSGLPTTTMAACTFEHGSSHATAASPKAAHRRILLNLGLLCRPNPPLLPGTPRNAPDGSRTRDLRLERPTLFGPPKGPVDH